MKLERYLTRGLVLAVALSGALALAQGKGKGRGEEKETTGQKIRKALPEGELVFTQQERTIITRWFRTDRSGLPPGLAKRDRLPPGLEKQLRERGTLPPGLQKRLQPLPFELERRLRPLPTDYRRVVIGGNVILMNQKTSVIYDIIRNTVP